MVRTIRNIETIGEKLRSESVVKRLVKATKAISHLLSKQHLPFFSKRVTKGRPRSQLEVAELKVNRDLMSRGHISCQSRAMNTDALFMYENHPCTQSMLDHGNLHVNKTSDSVACLEHFTTPVSDPSARTVSD